MYSSIDTIWMLMCAAIVFFMQAGFAMVETGFTRAKNAGNIIMKNIIDVSIGTLVFWFVGFGLMFGTDIMGIVGTPDLFVQNDIYGAEGSYPSAAYLIFQSVFCAATATIVSGAMAERTKFSSYCIYTIIICAFVYPVSGHWIWGGGWLAELGFHDFAGSVAVHMVGGVAALVGAWMVGPRIGKYNKDGKSNAIPGHSLTLGALGVFILWFGWFGFNGGSILSVEGESSILLLSELLWNTMISAAVAAVAAMIVTWRIYKKPDVSMTLNGALGGLVGITAGCDVVTPAGSAAIGLISGLIIVFGVEFIDKKLKVDDPVGAVTVHGFCGAAGVILVGLFSIDGGILYGGGFELLGIQLLGTAATAAWVAVTMGAVFYIIKKTIGLRVTREEELYGLDLYEHGLESSYADFMMVPEQTSVTAQEFSEAAVKEYFPPAADMNKMTKIVIVTNRSRLSSLKDRLSAAGITGMTVSYVMGCGTQRGHTSMYRGSELDSTLLPKVKVEVVVCRTDPSIVVNAAKKALCTGSIGDGKIFIYNVENAIKISTGEEGCSALQDTAV